MTTFDVHANTQAFKCFATTKRNQPCRNWAMSNSRWCHIHHDTHCLYEWTSDETKRVRQRIIRYAKRYKKYTHKVDMYCQQNPDISKIGTVILAYTGDLASENDYYDDIAQKAGLCLRLLLKQCRLARQHNIHDSVIDELVLQYIS